MLELQSVVKHYASSGGEVVRAIDGVTMSVASGELVALYGPSGSGKTTLLLMVAALLAPDSGQVLVEGRAVSSLSAREGARYRRLELGFVRQQLDLLPGGRRVGGGGLEHDEAPLAVHVEAVHRRDYDAAVGELATRRRDGQALVADHEPCRLARHLDRVQLVARAGEEGEPAVAEPAGRARPVGGGHHAIGAVGEGPDVHLDHAVHLVGLIGEQRAVGRDRRVCLVERCRRERPRAAHRGAPRDRA